MEGWIGIGLNWVGGCMGDSFLSDKIELSGPGDNPVPIIGSSLIPSCLQICWFPYGINYIL